MMKNFEVIPIQDKIRWSLYLDAMPSADIYYHREYAKSLQLHGDGIPLLVYYEDEHVKMCFVVMKNDISKNCHFLNKLSPNTLYDLETPYGYGGPYVSGDFTKDSQSEFYKLFSAYCSQENIVSLFVRFHPLLDNFKYSYCFDELVYLKNTIYIDLSSQDSIFTNMDAKNRNMIRKAVKHGVSIIYDCGERMNEFTTIYNETMRHKNADDYYFFSTDYYEYIKNNLNDNIIYFYSIYESKVISAAIFFYTKEYMHYHLSGTVAEYRQLASTNLLLYKAALWGNEHGLTKLHLGGGMSNNDSLFGFKKQFNKLGQVPFYIGRTIFLKEAYNELLFLRKKEDPFFDINNDHMIQYRK